MRIAKVTRTSFAEHGECGFCNVYDAKEVRFNLIAKTPFCRFLNRCARCIACIVDNNVEGSKGSHRCIDRSLGGLGIGHLESQYHDCLSVDLQSRELIRIPSCREYPISTLKRGLGNLPPKAP